VFACWLLAALITAAPQLAVLGPALAWFFGGFDLLFDRPAPYVSAWHQAPTAHRNGDFALHLELFTIRRASRQAQVPGRLGVGHGRLRQRHRPEAAAARLRQLG
jgi:UDPglucose--hexose-1-phosphate uridylyltransferase